jgi:hypothetical protein
LPFLLDSAVDLGAPHLDEDAALEVDAGEEAEDEAEREGDDRDSQGRTPMAKDDTEAAGVAMTLPPTLVRFT